jgi:Ca2+-binding EF-hand superfamily protein
MSKQLIKETLKDGDKLERTCEAAWMGVDTNNTGHIDEYEMGTVVNSVLMDLGFYEIPNEVDKALSEYKSNKGRISLNDFKEFMKNVLGEILRSE